MNHFPISLIATVALLGCASAPKTAPPHLSESPLESMLAAHGYLAVPLVKVSSGQLLIKSQINGLPAMLVLDSGASVTVLDRSALETFSLSRPEETPIPAFGLGTVSTAAIASVGSLVIGPLQFENRPTLLVDLGQLTKVVGLMSGQQVHGVLGQDILESQEAIIDFRRRLLYVRPQ
jgi:predicted aspartyl protease